jgi:hypothetical protein
MKWTPCQLATHDSWQNDCTCRQALQTFFELERFGLLAAAKSGQETGHLQTIRLSTTWVNLISGVASIYSLLDNQ